MKDSLNNYVQRQLVLLPKGTELIRDFVDEQRWISSNSRMSIPGLGKNTKEIERQFDIAPFFMARYPVTKGLYNAIVVDDSFDCQKDPIPVVNISWYDAVMFCNLLSQATGLEECYSFDRDADAVSYNWSAKGYRLPTDAEWQYACKAGSTGYRYGDLDNIAWYRGNSAGEIHEVGEKAPNAWNLYDMLGNVWEWCWDLYDETRYGPYRLFRGGSWSEQARGCGASCRRKSHPSLRIDDLGFRLARSF